MSQKQEEVLSLLNKYVLLYPDSFLQLLVKEIDKIYNKEEGLN